MAPLDGVTDAVMLLGWVSAVQLKLGKPGVLTPWAMLVLVNAVAHAGLLPVTVCCKLIVLPPVPPVIFTLLLATLLPQPLQL